MFDSRDQEKKPNPRCKHIFKQVGLWDGEDEAKNLLSGVTAKCLKCGGVSRFTHREWQDSNQRGVYCDWGGHFASADEATDYGQATLCKECERSISSRLKEGKEEEWQNK